MGSSTVDLGTALSDYSIPFETCAFSRRLAACASESEMSKVSYLEINDQVAWCNGRIQVDNISRFDTWQVVV